VSLQFRILKGVNPNTDIPSTLAGNLTKVVRTVFGVDATAALTGQHQERIAQIASQFVQFGSGVAMTLQSASGAILYEDEVRAPLQAGPSLHAVSYDRVAVPLAPTTCNYPWCLHHRGFSLGASKAGRAPSYGILLGVGQRGTGLTTAVVMEVHQPAHSSIGSFLNFNPADSVVEIPLDRVRGSTLLFPRNGPYPAYLSAVSARHVVFYL
jgi:hypothetical protein